MQRVAEEWDTKSEKTQKMKRPTRDSNAQSSEPKSDALAIRPMGPRFVEIVT